MFKNIIHVIEPVEVNRFGSSVFPEYICAYWIYKYG